jgi:hypothetical protein
MEYTHSVSMFKIKQGILYDLVTGKGLKFIYVTKYIFYKISVILWGGERESVKVLK